MGITYYNCCCFFYFNTSEAAEALRTHVEAPTQLVLCYSCAPSRLEQSSIDMKNASDVVSETQGCLSARMLRWDQCPAKLLGSTYVEPEDVPTVSVPMEEWQMATHAERASVEDKDGNARVVSPPNES